MELNLLRAAVCQAGGVRQVGKICGVSYQAVQKWLVNGLPRSEFSGETQYARKICELASTNGHELQSDVLLQDSARFLQLRRAANC